jgi:hypothetical protein
MELSTSSGESSLPHEPVTARGSATPACAVLSPALDMDCFPRRPRVRPGGRVTLIHRRGPIAQHSPVLLNANPTTQGAESELTYRETASVIDFGDRCLPKHELVSSAASTYLALTDGDFHEPNSGHHEDRKHKSKEITMRTMFFAAAATLLILGGMANANAADHLPAAQTRDVAAFRHQGQASTRGLPSYELRQDGTTINGLLPAHRWQG